MMSRQRSNLNAAVWLLLAITLPRAAQAQKRVIDSQRSTMKVAVYKSGLFSAFAHDHQILAPISDGSVDDSGNVSVELVIDTRKLKVLDPGISDKDRSEIQSRMLSPEVLDASRYPEIHFQSVEVKEAADSRWTVRGNLALHGQVQPLAIEVSEQGGRYRGSLLLKQSDYGIKPVSIAGGTVKVKDTVRIDFEIFVAR